MTDLSLLLPALESLVLIVAPLLVLSLAGRWPMRVAIPCLLVTPVLWYLTYSPIHELSHVLGTYLAGGSVTGVRLIPSFWRGEFARAWITPKGLTAPWQQLVMTGWPYVLDGVSVAAGLLARRRFHLLGPLALGVALMLLCLRPGFDLVCETVAFALGGRGDLHHIALATGPLTVWLSMALLIGLTLFTITRLVLEGTSRTGKAAA